MARADASAAHAVEVLLGHVQEVGRHSEAQTLRVAEVVTQHLEKEIEAAVTSVATIAEVQTHTTMEGMRQNVQAQIEQNGADAQRGDGENQKTI